MLILGSLASNKTDILIDKYVELLNSGIDASKILVIVQNSTLKNDFIEKSLSKIKINTLEKLEIYSFFGLVYNTIQDNWAFLEDRNIYDNNVILPHLAGLEVSQFIFKDILKKIPFKGYNSRQSLIQQLFRRYQLIIQNNLSKKDIKERTKILKEGFSDEAEAAINIFLKKTLKLRDFDYLRQCLLFNFIYNNTDYFSNIKYLLVDDADECTPICVDFLNYLSKNLKEKYIALDKLGSSRCGYLSADKNNYNKFKQITTLEQQCLEDNINEFESLNLYKNIKDNEKNVLNKFTHSSFAKRTEMLNATIKQVKILLNKKVSPNEISIISPIIDNMLKITLENEFKHLINFVYISGNEKLIQNRLVKAALAILKMNTPLKTQLTEFDLRTILNDILQIPLKNCENILSSFSKTQNLMSYKFNDETYNKKYNALYTLVNELSNSSSKISDQVIKIYNNLFDFKFIEPNELSKFNFFLKEIRDFEEVFGQDFNVRKTDIILQIENSIISENPYSILKIDTKDLVISTPQKIIDNKILTKYQFWLDISNQEWIKSDIGPLYNAWVFQKDWDKENYTIDDNLTLSRDKTARIIRKLSLCAKQKIFCYSSLFDSNGIENYGAIEQHIICSNNHNENITSTDPTFKIIPRPDQQPVLEYKNGYLGISAVPGAGKTTILLALIIKLLDSGINPENIFVLTYMDSAARNFRERIKNVKKESNKLPNISTIHGLSLRILKENGNYEKLGLNSDFEICDDAYRNRIFHEIGEKLKIDIKKAEEYTRGVSTFKIDRCDFFNQKLTPELIKFKSFYDNYQNTLKELNLIDYDDMLSGAVRILEENPDILNYYQNVCQYIIEDEAQDSSSVQQRLISLLSGKYKNVIRCGDVNQSITMTFSNADVKGFKEFITKNNNVTMNCSQRCTQGVWELANKLVKTYTNKQDSQESFFEIYMQPVQGKNPEPYGKAVISKVFESATEEKNYIVKSIKNILSNKPKYSIGILLRNNSQVAQWQNLLVNNGLKVITRSNCLEQKSIFKVIFACLKIILDPFNNKNIAENYAELAELGLYKTGLNGEIDKYNNPFITINPENITQESLAQFWWDLNYWVSLSSLPNDEIAIKIGSQFFSSEIDKFNIYLIATLVKRICLKNNSLSYLILRLAELSKRPNLNGYKFFSEEDEDNNSFLEGKIQVMTMHKSKGDEFNVVFIPELSEWNLNLDIKSIKINSSNLIESIKKLNKTYIPKSEYVLKQEILTENLKLLYVAITRAKNKLIISANTQSKRKDNKKTKPNPIFEELLGDAEYVQ